MEGHGDIIFYEGSLHQFHKIGVVGVCPCAFGHLEDDRRLQLSCRLCDTLYDLHIIYIEGSDGIAALISFLKHILCCH